MYSQDQTNFITKSQYEMMISSNVKQQDGRAQYLQALQKFGLVHDRKQLLMPLPNKAAPAVTVGKIPASVYTNPNWKEKKVHKV